jgi:hypothetical protein
MVSHACLGKLGAISWVENKHVSILSTAFSPIDPTHAKFVIWWCLISPLEIPISPMLIHYQEHMCRVDV